MTAVTPILELENVSKSFGSLRVISELSLSIRQDEAVGIIGPNGAGKTTLFNLVSGNLNPDSGRIFLRGRDITALPPHRRCHAGVGRTYQVPHPFEGMTVFENVLVGAAFGNATSEREAHRAGAEALERTGMAPLANKLAGSLTLLERKRLELTRAVATAPAVLLLDELAGGLTEPEVRQLVAIIRQLHKEGIAIVWIEHVVHALLSAVQRLVVIHANSILIQGVPAAIMASPEVQRVYLGIGVE
jgi:branched-chain amino acid transport system ATP-binding protein